jgi:hypothetical protein
MMNSITVKQPDFQAGLPMIESGLLIVGDTMYIQGLFPDQPQMWTKTPAPDNYWKLLNQAGQLAALLQGQNATILTPEKVHSGNLDILCDVLQVTPDLKTLWSLMTIQPGIQLPKDAPPGVAFSQFIKKAQMKLWIAQDSGFPIKSELSMSFQIGPAQVQALKNDISMDIIINMLYYDYNKAITIDLPDEAKNATDLKLEKAP